MKKIKIYLLLIAVFSVTLSAFGTQKFFESKTKVPPSPIYNNTIMVPKGYILNVSVKNNIDADTISVADNYDVILKTDFIYKGIVIAPEGSIIKGKITRIRDDNKTKKINIKFTNIISQNGMNLPISAVFTEEAKSGFINLNETDKIFENSESSIITKQPVTYIAIH
ncbi:hypothetical protein IJS77_03740 [bacterium]|nr:hypothetical protein [bacterium]